MRGQPRVQRISPVAGRDAGGVRGRHRGAGATVSARKSMDEMLRETVAWLEDNVSTFSAEELDQYRRKMEDPTLDGIFRTFADDCLELIEAELTVRAI